MAIKRPIVLYDGVHKELQDGDTIPNSLLDIVTRDGIDIVLSTNGNGTNTFTLSKAVDNVLVAVDGVIQYDFTQPNGTNQLVFGFIPNTNSLVTVFNFNEVAASSFNKYATDIGNGSLTTIVVTHNLNTVDITISLYRNSDGVKVDTNTSITDANNVTLTFNTAPTTNQYRIVITG